MFCSCDGWLFVYDSGVVPNFVLNINGLVRMSPRTRCRRWSIWNANAEEPLRPVSFKFLDVNSKFINLSLYYNLTKYIISSSGSRSNKTFKPKKNIPEGTHQYDLMRHAAATLGSGNLRLAVMLPEGEDLNEWVAVNSMFSTYSLLLSLFKINKIYKIIIKLCI